jgi:dTDP-4-amino-4,6-dideoxygalactose transaminase
MEILLHHDYLTKALSSKEESSVLKLCQTGRCKGWIASTTIQTLWQALGKDERNKIKPLLAHLSVVTPTARDLEDALQGDDFQEKLALTLSRSCGFDAIVSIMPEKFSNNERLVLTADQIESKINGPVDSVNEVKLLDISASYHQILNDVEKEIADTTRTGQFILGSKVIQLEEKIAEYCQTKYAVGVSSGTDALLISLMAAGIGEGDEVITSPYTFFATAGSIVRSGAKPVFVDINDVTFNIKAEHIERHITPKTKAIMPVHLYGQCADMKPIMELAKKHNLVVIEDAAQSIGSEYKKKRAGSLGDMGCFSFFPAKNLGAFGDGGIVTTSSDNLYEKLKMLRVHGSKLKYYYKSIGGNFRLDSLQAGIVKAKLGYLEGWTDKRRQNATIYNQLFQQNALTQYIQLPPEVFPRHVFNQYIIRTGSRRDELRTFLNENKIGCEIYYPLPLHVQECFESLGYKKGDFPESEKAANETLALPISHEITRPQQEYIVENIRRFFLGE